MEKWYKDFRLAERSQKKERRQAFYIATVRMKDPINRGLGLSLVWGFPTVQQSVSKNEGPDK